MQRGKRLESRTTRRRTFKPPHKDPGPFRLGYILLPYGQFYDTTKDIAAGKKGDTLRFFNGPEYQISSVMLIRQDKLCDFLCRMRYGISIMVAFEKWKSNAILEGYGKDILSKEECILVIYETESE